MSRPENTELLESLRVVSLPGSHPLKHQEQEYKTAYAMWKAVWRETFAELDGVKENYSDDFTRQDEILCIFRGPLCLAMGVMRWTNYELPTVREDSYFKMWPDEAFDGLDTHGSNVIICSNLTVDPLARGNKLGIPMKDLMVGLLVQRFLESGANAMTGIMRTDRSMHTTTYRFGATMLTPNLIHHNVPVDLVAFFPQYITRGPQAVAGLVDYLWNHKREVAT